MKKRSIKINAGRRVLALLGIISILLFVTGCSLKTDNELKPLDKQNAQKVKEDLAVFASGDIFAITESVFGDSIRATTENDESDGIVADLFSNAEAQVTEVEDTTITYTIVAPDISDFFHVYADELATIDTSEELGQELLEYSQKAPEKVYTVTLEYVITGEGMEISYNNPEFINAMTGGLLEAYYDAYTQYLVEED